MGQHNRYLLKSGIQLIIKIPETIFDQGWLFLLGRTLFRSRYIAVGAGKIIPHIFQLLAGNVGNTLEDHYISVDLFLYIGIGLSFYLYIPVMSFVAGITLLVRHIQGYADFNQAGFIIYFFVEQGFQVAVSLLLQQADKRVVPSCTEQKNSGKAYGNYLFQNSSLRILLAHNICFFLPSGTGDGQAFPMTG